MTLQLKPGRLVLSDTADEAAWHAARRTGIGASEIAAVAGLSSRRTAVDVWDAKVYGEQFEPSDDMRWGTFIEGRIIDWWARETGRTVGAGGLFRHPDHEWLLATPDAVVLAEPAATVVATVDAKNQGWHTKEDWEDGAPVDYLAQITQQMLALGVRKGYLVATVGGKPPFEREIDLDEDFAQMLVDAGSRLWDAVQAKVPPRIDGSRAATRWLARRYPHADPSRTVELDDADVQKIRERLAIEASVATLTELSTEIENEIKAKLGDAWAGTYGGRDYVTWKKTQRAGYTVRPTTYRRFHIPASAKREMGHGER